MESNDSQQKSANGPWRARMREPTAARRPEARRPPPVRIGAGQTEAPRQPGEPGGKLASVYVCPCPCPCVAISLLECPLIAGDIWPIGVCRVVSKQTI